MKLTLKQIKEIEIGLAVLSKTKMNDKAAYRVARCIRKLTPELEDIEKKRMELIKKHNITVETKNTDPVIELFTKDFNDLLTIEIDVDVHKITFEDIAGLSIEPYVLVSLDAILELKD